MLGLKVGTQKDVLLNVSLAGQKNLPSGGVSAATNANVRVGGRLVEWAGCWVFLSMMWWLWFKLKFKGVPVSST